MSTTTCPTCTRPANDGYVNIAADEACMDPCHRRRSRRHAVAEAYSTLCSRAAAHGIPTSLDDPASPQTVAALEAAVAATEGEEHPYEIKVGLTGDSAEADTAEDALAAAAQLVRDANQDGIQGRTRAARDTILIARHGRYDGALTEIARNGIVHLDALAEGRS